MIRPGPPDRRRAGRSWRVAAASALLLLTLGHLYASYTRPLNDECDLALSAGQALRVLQGQAPFRDYVPGYGPTQQYATAAVMALWGRDVHGARGAALVFVLLGSLCVYALIRALPPRLRPGRAVALAAAALVTIQQAPELTPQGTYMMLPAICLCGILVLRTAAAACPVGRGVVLLAAAAGLATAFCIGAKPHIGLVLVLGTALGLLWPGQGRWGRLAGALLLLAGLVLISVPRNAGCCGPYVVAPLLLCVLALRSPAGPCCPLRARSMPLIPYVGLALVGGALSYVLPAGESGVANFLEWASRLSRASQVLMVAPMDRPLRFNAWTLSIVAVTVALYVAATRLSRVSGYARVLLVAALLAPFAVAAHGIDRTALWSLSLAVNWLPSLALIAVLLARRAGDDPAGPPLGEPAVGETLALLPLSTALLTAAYPASSVFDAYALTLVLCLGWVNATAAGPAGEDADLGRRLGVPAGACLSLAVLRFAVVSLGWSLILLAQMLLGGRADVAAGLFRARYPNAEQSAVDGFARYLRPGGLLSALPIDRQEALGTLRAEGARGIFCFPSPLPTLLVPGSHNVSGIDYWFRPYLSDAEVAAEAARLDRPDCAWFYAEQWAVVQLDWREKARLSPEEQRRLAQRSPREVLETSFPELIGRLRESPEWTCVRSDPCVELWRKRPGGR